MTDAEGSRAAHRAGTGPDISLHDGGPTLGRVAAPKAAQALRDLLGGNVRYRTGRPARPNGSLQRLQELAAGQQPRVMTLACADSRVPPEILFDQGIGDVFVNRVAGHVVDDALLGSIEYAAEHLHVPLLVVLGHESCGAVGATLDAIRTGAAPAGHIGAIVSALRPAIEPVLVRGGDLMREAVLANVRWSVAQVQQRSHIVRELVQRGELAVVGAHVGLRTGQVTLLD